MDERTQSSGTDRPIARRPVIAGTAAAVLGAVAGCLGDDGGEVADPITIDDDRDCDNCTMVVGNHPGPAGQAHYAEPTAVLDEDRPAQFCSSLCAYAFTFEHDDPEVVYLTDYSTVDYEIQPGDDGDVLSRHLEAEAFGDASALALVADSDVDGAMGASIVGFGDADDADDFQDEYGGERYEHDEITNELIMSLMS